MIGPKGIHRKIAKLPTDDESTAPSPRAAPAPRLKRKASSDLSAEVTVRPVGTALGDVVLRGLEALMEDERGLTAFAELALRAVADEREVLGSMDLPVDPHRVDLPEAMDTVEADVAIRYGMKDLRAPRAWERFARDYSGAIGRTVAVTHDGRESRGTLCDVVLDAGLNVVLIVRTTGEFPRVPGLIGCLGRKRTGDRDENYYYVRDDETARDFSLDFPPAGDSEAVAAHETKSGTRRPLDPATLLELEDRTKLEVGGVIVEWGNSPDQSGYELRTDTPQSHLLTLHGVAAVGVRDGKHVYEIDGDAALLLRFYLHG